MFKKEYKNDEEYELKTKAKVINIIAYFSFAQNHSMFHFQGFNSF